MTERAKPTIPYPELLKKVQGILAFFPEECRNVHIDNLEVYREQVDGANWHVATYRCSGDDNDLVECKEKLVMKLRALRDSYDVA